MTPLIQQLDHFLYTHAPHMPKKNQLVSLIRAAEQAYLEKIRELESRLANASLNQAPTTSRLQDDDSVGNRIGTESIGPPDSTQDMNDLLDQINRRQRRDGD